MKLQIALLIALCFNMAIMSYHLYRLSVILNDVDRLKNVVKTVQELYTIVGGSMSDRMSLVREKVDLNSLGTYLKKLRG